MEVFDIVRIISGILMILGYIVMCAVLIYGIVQCFCVEDIQPDGSLDTISQTMDEEQELDTFIDQEDKKKNTDLLTGDSPSPPGPDDDDCDSMSGDSRSLPLEEDGNGDDNQVETKSLKVPQKETIS